MISSACCSSLLSFCALSASCSLSFSSWRSRPAAAANEAAVAATVSFSRCSDRRFSFSTCPAASAAFRSASAAACLRASAAASLVSSFWTIWRISSRRAVTSLSCNLFNSTIFSSSSLALAAACFSCSWRDWAEDSSAAEWRPEEAAARVAFSCSISSFAASSCSVW